MLFPLRGLCSHRVLAEYPLTCLILSASLRQPAFRLPDPLRLLHPISLLSPSQLLSSTWVDFQCEDSAWHRITVCIRAPKLFFIRTQFWSLSAIYLRGPRHPGLAHISSQASQRDIGPGLFVDVGRVRVWMGMGVGGQTSRWSKLVRGRQLETQTSRWCYRWLCLNATLRG